MRGREVQEFEGTLKKLFDRIDDELEDRWGGEYPLHPARPARGVSTNKETDGLFNVGASFSAGYGSEHGKGYVVDVRLVTLSDVPDETIDEIHAYIARRIEELLPEYFPGRELDVVREGNTFKIIGDLSLS
ncbi:MAG: hypothetical protein ACOC2V_04015 [Alkalispirochaeta sp.]